MASSTPASPHESTQFLNNLLTRRGPNALPYKEDAKFLIREHLLKLIHDFPGLHVRPFPFVHNDGTSVNLLQVDGTVPMSYHNHTYNIPVTIWLLETYPRTAPRVFVTPTKDMIIKRPHRHVDASGLVSIPYLQNWVYPRSNLTELASSLSLMFGHDPPLYSKPSNGSPRVQRTSTSHSVGSASPQPSPSTQQPPPSTRPYGSHTTLPPSPQPLARQSSRTENPSDVFRRNAISSLVERLRQDVTEVRRAREAGMDELVTVQGQLKQRENQLQLGVQEMMKEKEALEQQLQVILTNTDVLESWLVTQNKSVGDIDIDDVFEPCDGLSKQMLDCTSADLAVEDVIYSLDKAVQEGAIPVDAYLKQVRSLSREQFFHRATYVKIHAIQLEKQVSNMAARYVT